VTADEVTRLTVCFRCMDPAGCALVSEQMLASKPCLQNRKDLCFNQKKGRGPLPVAEALWTHKQTDSLQLMTSEAELS